MVSPAPIFTTLINVKRHYFQTSHKEFHTNRTIKVQNTGKTLFMLLSECIFYCTKFHGTLKREMESDENTL